MTAAARQGVLWEAGKFSATASGLRVKGSPSLGEWASAIRNIVAAKNGVQWAIGDLLLHADGKGWTHEAVEEVLDATGLQRGTLQNMRSIALRFPRNQRRDLPWSHHVLVASLSNEEAQALLTRAEQERWGWEELRAHAREQRQAQQRLSQAWPEGKFGVVYAKSPWGSDAERATATDRHPRMTTKQMTELAEHVKGIAATDCALYMWAPTDKLLNGEVAELLKAWGFTPRDAHVWVADLLGAGTWARARHQHLIVATKGQPAPPAEDRRPDSVIEAPTREGTRFPDEVYALLEHCYPGVPKVELFARHAREGWRAWGDQLGIGEAPRRAVRVRERPEATPTEPEEATA